MERRKVTVLIDTHILIWMINGDKRLGQRALDLVITEGSRDRLVVSAISFWEIATLKRKGRLSLNVSLAWIYRDLFHQGPLREEPVTGPVGYEAGNLPAPLHGDPADRLIVATARLNGWQLATRDRQILDYGDRGFVETLVV